MGAVYLAEDASGNRVALKLLGAELARDERFRRRFLGETEVAAGLDHPHIVPTLASGEEDGRLYLAMAYVEGSDLRELLRREGRLEPERALRLLAQVADALDAAHEAGLVHRDVKPGNILVAGEAPDERAFVCDFGLARHVSSVRSLTGDRGFVGTVDYVPPEQIQGERMDGRADVYSLACVLYECLTGVRPFDRESELAVVFAHLNEPPPRLSDLRPELPDALDAVFQTALAKSPGERYSTCRELVEAARAALRGKVFRRRRLRRRRTLLAAAAMLAAGGATLGGVLTTRDGHNSSAAEPHSISLEPDALNLIDATTHHVVDRVDIGERVPVADTGWDVAFSKRSAWLLLAARQQVLKVDLASRKVTRVIGLPWRPGRITTGGGSVWVSQDFGPELRRIDAEDGRVVGRIAIPDGVSAGGLAYGAGSLWLQSGPGVLRIDPRSGGVLHRFRIEGIDEGMPIVFADGAVWAARHGNGVVVKIDPAENRITADTKLHGFVSDLAVGGGFVWVSVVPDGVVFKLSKDDLSLRANPAAGPDPERISYGGDQLWIANPASNTVSRVAPNGGRQEFVAEAVPAVAAYHDGLVWVGAARVLPPLPPIQGQELRLATMSDAGLRLDPLQGGLWDEQLRYATCATLLNYPDSAGPRGSRLRPEIAAAMPTLSRDRRTYTFRIRPGFRFSPPSNEPVTAQTFRHTLERALAPANRDFGAWVLSDIVGASAYTAGRAEHVSGIAVRGSALSITLVKPAGDFLARISLLRFCPVPLSIPVPRSIPIRPNGPPTPIASAGPYYVASSAGGRTVLLRNPNYPGKRPRRSERIVYESDVPEAQAIALADRGAVDFLPGFDASDLLSPGGPIDRRYGSGSTAARRGAQRYFLYQAPIYDYLAFNTRRPLFRDDRLRRAVNYALDRRALARAFGDSPADQVVPPAVPGYPAGRIYPTDGPDLTTARRLAGGRERRTILYMCGDPRERTLARIIARNLAKIRMAISTVEAKDCPGPGDGLSARADLFLVSGWPWLESDERDPGLFIDKALRAGLYGNPLGPGPWRRHDFEKRLERARLLVGPARIDRYRRLSDELTRDAPFAVFGSWVWPEYFSPKVGCKLFHPVYGVVDLGALCIRV